ncbi:ribosomal RNA small subunit methyltransferase A, partial [bacterium]|nr:ribosomal RNA small subunit methyltransferase A [bacterium]
NREDVVLEIGPGLGALTKEIANKCKKIIAIEIDKKLVQILKEYSGNYKNIEIIRGSILDGIPVLALKEKKYKVVANLPFNITGRVLRILLEQKNKPELIIVVVQKEVAQRITAKPPNMSLLSLSIQFYSQVSTVFNVNKSNFWPQPKVDSMVLKIKPNEFKIKKEIEYNFFQLIKAGFSSKRKYLLNNLLKSVIMQASEHGERKQRFLEIFKEVGLNRKVRAQELSLKQWIEIAYNIGTLEH